MMRLKRCCCASRTPSARCAQPTPFARCAQPTPSARHSRPSNDSIRSRQPVCRDRASAGSPGQHPWHDGQGVGARVHTTFSRHRGRAPCIIGAHLDACSSGASQIGIVPRTDRGAEALPRWIIHLPTEKRWPHPSKLEYAEGRGVGRIRCHRLPYPRWAAVWAT